MVSVLTVDTELVEIIAKSLHQLKPNNPGHRYLLWSGVCVRVFSTLHERTGYDDAVKFYDLCYEGE